MTYISSLSGGQDSTAMTLRLLELKAPLDYILFTDTGYELPEMYEYIAKLNKYFKTKFDKEIITLEPKTSIQEWAVKPYKDGKHKGEKRGLPNAIGMSYCTRELKVHRTRDFIKSLNLKLKDVTCYVGYTAREVNRKCGDNGYKCEYPLKEWGWNEPEVSAYLKEKSIYNKLYDNFSRTGCFCCPKQNLQSWYVVYSKYPKLWEWCKQMEQTAKEQNCIIKTWRADGRPLKDREKEFQKIKDTPTFDFDWNEQDVSCFCK